MIIHTVFRLLGEKIIDRIREHINEFYLGEAPLYTSFVIPTNNDTIKRLIYTVSFTRSSAQTSYDVVWSSLLSIRNYNKGNYRTHDFVTFDSDMISVAKEKIRGFVSKGVWQHNQKFQGDFYEYSAREMYLAYHNLLNPPRQVEQITNQKVIVDKVNSTYLELKDEELSKGQFFILTDNNPISILLISSLSVQDQCDRSAEVS